MKTASDGAELVTSDGKSFCVVIVNWEGSPADRRQTSWRYSARRWEVEDRSRCLDVMSTYKEVTDNSETSTKNLKVVGKIRRNRRPAPRWFDPVVGRWSY